MSMVSLPDLNPTPSTGELSRRADQEPLPNSDDVTAAAEAVAQLAQVYHLNTTLLANTGLLQGLHHQQLRYQDVSLHQHHALSG